jgi:hypothetical protein
MTKVFVGGSRRISRLNEDIRRRIDRIVAKRLRVLIGDANGVDMAFQRYLQARGYDYVEVFCAGEAPRNNLGGWPLRAIRPPHSSRDFDYYASKDRVMATEATVGLMIWDGESRGTLLNILRLLSQGKAIAVYVGPKKAFIEVRTRRGFDDLISVLDGKAARRLYEQAVSEGLADAAIYQAGPSF